MKKYKKIQHPHLKDGFHLIFPERTWSCVDLSRPNDKFPMPFVGIMYDTLGGRFEAMITTGDGIDPDHQVRASSFSELFKKVEKYNKTIK